MSTPPNIQSEESLSLANIAKWEALAGSVHSTFPLELLKGFSLSNHRIVLDYGCGSGRLGEFLHEKRNGDLFGIDASETMCSLARMKNTYRTVSCTTTPFDPTLSWMNFDVILLLGVLSSIPSDFLRRTLIQSLITYLRPGGYLILGDFDGGSEYDLRYELKAPEPRMLKTTNDLWIRHLTQAELMNHVPNSLSVKHSAWTQCKSLNGNNLRANLIIAN